MVTPGVENSTPKPDRCRCENYERIEKGPAGCSQPTDKVAVLELARCILEPTSGGDAVAARGFDVAPQKRRSDAEVAYQQDDMVVLRPVPVLEVPPPACGQRARHVDHPCEWPSIVC